MVIMTTFQIHSPPHPWYLRGHWNLTPDHRSTLVYNRPGEPFYGDSSVKLLEMGRHSYGDAAAPAQETAV